MEEMVSDKNRHFSKEASHTMARTTYFRASMLLMVTLVTVLLTTQKPAEAIGDGLCFPPWCPPETTITFGPSGTVSEYYALDWATFEFRGTTYNQNLRFQCRLDGSPWSTCTSPKDYTELSDGTHTFEVRATDSWSVDNSPASRTWTVDTTKPPLPDTTPPETYPWSYSMPNGILNSTTASFSFTGRDDFGGTAVADLKFECRFDSTSESDWSECISPKEYPNLGEGSSHTFQVRARDSAGNGDTTPSSAQFVVDTTPPETTITSKPSDPSDDITPTFEFSGSDNLSGFECKLSTPGGVVADWHWCASPRTHWLPTSGTYTFEVRALDKLNRRDPTQASYTWTYTAPPNVTIDSGPFGAVNSSTATFNFSSDVNAATFECKLDNGDFERCSSPKEYTGLAEGSHSFEVQAKNSAGTAGTKATRHWWVDVTPPPAPSITSPANNSFDADGNLTISGTSEPSVCGNAIELFEGSVSRGKLVSSCSNWSINLTGITDGSHTYIAKAIDPVGNVSGESNPITVTVDATAPAVPSIVSPAEGRYDNDGTFTVSGTAEANSTVSLSEGTASQGTTTVDDAGNWSIELTNVTEGSHAYRAKATDRAGHASAESEARTVMVDTTKPTVVSMSPPNRATGVGRGISLTATFSEKMKASTINARTFNLFKVNPDRSTTRVTDVVVTLSSDGLKATLNPFGTKSTVLEKNTKYKAVITTGARDLASNSLGQPKSWTFSTR